MELPLHVLYTWLPLPLYAAGSFVAYITAVDLVVSLPKVLLASFVLILELKDFMAPKFGYIDVASAAENEIEAAKNIIISVDLVAAARKQLHLLKAVGNMPCLHHGPVVLDAIRRYKKLWLPLAAELG